METNEQVNNLENLPISTDIMEALSIGLNLVLPNEKMEFFRTNRHAVKCTPGISTDNGFQQHPDGSTKRTKGHKKGVFLACPDLDDENKIIIGFSLCHKFDRFDYREGARIPGLGKWYALQKAEKYGECAEFKICYNCADKQLPKTIVKIPQSMAEGLEKFILRCRKYYKDKTLPPWTTQFAPEMEDTEV
jgi:hypothetical protein